MSSSTSVALVVLFPLVHSVNGPPYFSFYGHDFVLPPTNWLTNVGYDINVIAYSANGSATCTFISILGVQLGQSPSLPSQTPIEILSTQSAKYKEMPVIARFSAAVAVKITLRGTTSTTRQYGYSFFILPLQVTTDFIYECSFGGQGHFYVLAINNINPFQLRIKSIATSPPEKTRVTVCGGTHLSKLVSNELGVMGSWSNGTLCSTQLHAPAGTKLKVYIVETPQNAPPYMYGDLSTYQFANEFFLITNFGKTLSNLQLKIRCFFKVDLIIALGTGATVVSCTPPVTKTQLQIIWGKAVTIARVKTRPSSRVVAITSCLKWENEEQLTIPLFNFKVGETKFTWFSDNEQLQNLLLLFVSDGHTLNGITINHEYRRLTMEPGVDVSSETAGEVYHCFYYEIRSMKILAEGPKPFLMYVVVLNEEHSPLYVSLGLPTREPPQAYGPIGIQLKPMPTAAFTVKPMTNQPSTKQMTTSQPAITQPATTQPATKEIATTQPATTQTNITSERQNDIVCPPNCRKNFCHLEDGEVYCTRCSSGYQLPLCSPCASGLAGVECSVSCNYCYNDLCDAVTGECSVQFPMWWLTMMTALVASAVIVLPALICASHSFKTKVRPYYRHQLEALEAQHCYEPYDIDDALEEYETEDFALDLSTEGNETSYYDVDPSPRRKRKHAIWELEESTDVDNPTDPEFTIAQHSQSELSKFRTPSVKSLSYSDYNPNSGVELGRKESDVDGRDRYKPGSGVEKKESDVDGRDRKKVRFISLPPIEEASHSDPVVGSTGNKVTAMPTKDTGASVVRTESSVDPEKYHTI